MEGLEIKVRAPRVILSPEIVHATRQTTDLGDYICLLKKGNRGNFRLVNSYDFDRVECIANEDAIKWQNPKFPETEPTSLAGLQMAFSPDVFYDGFWRGEHHFSMGENGVYNGHPRWCSKTCIASELVLAVYDTFGNKVF